MFIKYPHLERYDTDEVDGINVGVCHIFPKLDGTNASVWWDGGVRGGSRNRELSLENDNAGFYAWASADSRIEKLLSEHRNLYLYGEWLVPHSLKTYREQAWRKFYVFDVYDLQRQRWMSYEEYKTLLEQYELDCVPVQVVVRNPSYEFLHEEVKRNQYLIQDGQGCGEGIVIKQYGYTNRFGRTTWAKLVTNEFKEMNYKAFGNREAGCVIVEQQIVDKFISQHVVDKVVEKIRNEKGQFEAKDIPRLLGQVYHDLVVEDLWEALKVFKNPKIDFKLLNQCCIAKTKQFKKELFGL